MGEGADRILAGAFTCERLLQHGLVCRRGDTTTIVTIS